MKATPRFHLSPRTEARLYRLAGWLLLTGLFALVAAGVIRHI